MEIKNNVFAITGGAQGLGFAMANAIAEKGGHLALLDINDEILQQAETELKKYGVTVKSYITNVAKENNVITSFEKIVNDFGQLNGVINNAGITRDGLLIKAHNGEIVKKLELADWQAVMDVNLTGVFLCAREAAEKMITTNSEGVIINISSISKDGNYGQTNYSAAKSGVAAMTVTWAKELARYNIRAAAIAPGFMATEMVNNMNQTALDNLKKEIPLGRLGEADEIAKAAISIIENNYFNGRVLEVDGGLRV